MCPQPTGTGGVQGQMTYQDQDQLRLSSGAETPSKRVVEKVRAFFVVMIGGGGGDEWWWRCCCWCWCCCWWWWWHCYVLLKLLKLLFLLLLVLLSLMLLKLLLLVVVVVAVSVFGSDTADARTVLGRPQLLSLHRHVYFGRIIFVCAIPVPRIHAL